MSDFKVTITECSVGGIVKVRIEQPNGFKFVSQNHDTIDHRFTRAVFELNPDGEEVTHELAYDIKVIDKGLEHSLTAEAIVDGKVKAWDRKHVKTGTTVP